MKLIAIALAVMTIGAGTALAYVRPSTPPQTPSVEVPDQVSGTDPGALSGSESSSLGSDSEVNRRRRPGTRPPSDRPPGGATNPVPEPGTMILASMGLLALGAAMRRRRH